MINSYNTNNDRYTCINNTCKQIFKNSSDCLKICNSQNMSSYIKNTLGFTKEKFIF